MAVITKQVFAAAPCEQIYAVLIDPLLMMQMRSDWGNLIPEQIAGGYPAAGSGFVLQPIEEGKSPIRVSVQEMLPNEKLVLSFDGGLISQLTWSLQSQDGGCRLQLEAVIDTDEEEIIRQEDEQARSWLENIKNYTGLGRSGWQGVLRWILERHVLHLRADQRRIIGMLLALQLVTILTFVAAVLGLGLVSLIVSWFKA
jgi:hypothetical protein